MSKRKVIVTIAPTGGMAHKSQNPHLPTQPQEIAWKHLANSKEVFERLVQVAATIDRQEWASFVAAQDYEGLEMLILRSLLGKAG